MMIWSVCFPGSVISCSVIMHSYIWLELRLLLMYLCIRLRSEMQYRTMSLGLSSHRLHSSREKHSLISDFALLQKIYVFYVYPKFYLSNEVQQAACVKGNPPWTRRGAPHPSHCSYMFLSRLRSCEPVNIESMGRCANSFSAERSKSKCVAARLYSSDRGLQKTPTSSVCPQLTRSLAYRLTTRLRKVPKEHRSCSNIQNGGQRRFQW